MKTTTAFCCSTKSDFQKDLPKGLPDDFRRLWALHDVDRRIFRTITVGENFWSDVDWEKEKEEGVALVVLCDDPHNNILSAFFKEVLFLAKLPLYWYSRVGGEPFLIEIKPLGESSLIGS